MNNYFTESHFSHGGVSFIASIPPVSVHSKNERKRNFQKDIQTITSQSEYIITGTCHIEIEYRCQHVLRRKNPGIYDVDNTIKPILDSLVGMNGLLIDDVLINRVGVNWQDTQDDEHIEINIEYPELLFIRKSNLVILKSQSGWCFPTSKNIIKSKDNMNTIKKYFNNWDSIISEDDYYDKLLKLPFQSFLYHAKLQNKGYNIIELT